MTITQCYELIGGDYKDILTRLPSEALVIKFLKKYAETDEVDKMLAAFQAKDYAQVFETSHNLKGMSLNLSLVKNNKTITEICEAVRHGDPTIDLAPLMEQAELEHQVLVSAVSQL